MRVHPFNRFHPLMSDRMADTAALIALGYLNKEIADELGLSIKTIEKFRDMLKKKMGCRGTADITRLAIYLGLIDLQSSINIPPS
jgi:two-component system, LuxR family, response regulator FixJ